MSMNTATILASELRCPHCGDVKAMTMPADACVFFHECASCHTLIRPRQGDCCVFCSYGTVACPPMQEGSSCCGQIETIISNEGSA